MKISTRSIYCLRLMVYLADHADRESPIALKEIAEAKGLPYRYLEQLVVPLKNAGLIKSVQGKHGGYALGRSADEITALEVFEATSGPVNLLKCVEEAQACTCDLVEFCPSRRMWVELTEAITGTMGKYTIEQLSERRMLESLGRTEADGTLAVRCDEPDEQGDT